MPSWSASSGHFSADLGLKVRSDERGVTAGYSEGKITEKDRNK